MSAIVFAKKYIERGWKVFPIRPRSKEPFGKDTLHDAHGEGGLKVATTHEATITQWFTRWPDANIAIATGRESGIVVLDVDAGKGGMESLLDLVAKFGKLPTTPESLTGGGGRHIIFKYPQGVDIRNSASKLGQGLDIRAEGGYIVAPPSIHPNGTSYQWEASSLPSSTPLADLPPWMVAALIEPPAQGEIRQTSAGVIDNKIPAGQRDQTLASLAGSMRRRGMGYDEIKAALVVTNDERCDPPLRDLDIDRIAKSVARYDPTAKPEFSGSGKLTSHEPLDAFGGLALFLDLLNNLEGRSISTFITPIDDALGGLERQTLSILAARPSMGKSTLAWQIARNVAASGQTAYFFSLEMSTSSLWAKAACGACGYRWRDFRSGKATAEMRRQVIDQTVTLMDAYENRILVDDNANTIETIWNMVDQYRPDIVIVDHLRLVSDRSDNEVQRLGNITKQLKDLAKVTNCHVMAAAQLNRSVEGRDNKRPQMSDLRDSGQIEENADTILMMYRDDYYDDDKTVMPVISKTELLVRKFRDDIANQRILIPFDTRHQWFGDRTIS